MGGFDVNASSGFSDRKGAELGFGLMRLPRKLAFTDVSTTSRMVDEFLEAGFSYFDTAPVYPGSEDAIGKALVKRHPRESFRLATKVNAWVAPTEAMAKKQIHGSLKRTKAEYFDYYVLHSLKRSNYTRYDRFGIWEYAQQLKDQGVVRNVGFSFHADSKLLDQILSDHPEVDFVMLQINYADWDNPQVESRRNYEVARSHGKPITVMEPVKGGKLANPPVNVRALLDEANPGASYPSWALRFVASLEGVQTVLSGMSNLQQLRDNIGFMRDFEPLSSDEQAVIRRAQALLGSSQIIGCTGCGYCVKGCPNGIDIPKVIEAINLRVANGQGSDAAELYKTAVAGRGLASSCVKCSACEQVCTQNLDIMAHMEQAASLFE